MHKQIMVAHQTVLDLLRAVSSKSTRECCGFFLGRYGGETTVIHQAVAVRNAVSRSDSFAIPDHERRRVERLAQSLGLRIVAIYHSHPSGSRELSKTDQWSLCYSDIPWIIVTLEETDGKPNLLLTAYDTTSGSHILIEISENQVGST